MLVLSALPAFGQRQGQCVVTGSVVTTDGQPAAHVNVLLKNTFYGAVTDSRGQFRFEAPAGEYTMQVFSITCHMREFPAVIRAGAGNHFSGITIVEDIKSLEQVVVTGQFSPQSLHNSVYKVRVIGSRQIEQKAANDVQSLLNTEIGVRLSNDMALGETDFELMGMSGNNVKVLIDGVPMVDRGSNKQSLSQIDVNSVERVEIVEGPMSVVYGTDALAGVINIITKKGAPDADKNTWSVSAGFQEESAGDEYALFDGKGLHRENVQLGWAGMSGIYANGGFTRYSTGGWQGDKTGRELMWQPKEQYIYNGVVGWKRGDLDMWYRLDYLDEELVTPANGTELHPEEVSDKKFATDRYTHQLQADWKISNRVKLNFASSYQSYKRRTTTIMMNTDTGEKWLSEESAGQDESKMQTFFSRATATWQAWPKLSFQPGVEWQWTKASGDRIAGEPTISDLAVYLSAEWRPLDWLNVRPGVRAIVNSGYDAPAAIPTLLTKFAITQNIDLRLSYAYGFRAPTLRELHFSFHNPNHNIDGNPDLKAEWSNNLTGALTWRILHGGDVRLTSTVSGFYNVFRDRIELVEVAPNTMQYTYGNIEKYKTTGGTLENTLMWKGLGASLNFSYIGRYNQLGDRDEYKDEDMTSFRWSPEVTASVTYSFAKSGTDLNLFYKFTGKRDHYAVSDDKVALLAMDSYHWADFTVSQKIGKYVRVNAGVKNIFDVSMVRNAAGGGMGSSGDASLLGYGRSFFLGASFVFNK
ncbi:TonB-dependent receptor [Alistipes sp. OttesenSCG-928-B03]|nr:TonB-dependent receptor [Alistipes sp. OttesenSCG-928-B03]